LSKKEEDEILVYTPPFPRIGYEELEDIGLTEKLNYLNICEKISKYTAGTMIIANLLLFLFSTYSLLNQTQFTFPNPFIILALAFMGIINLINGLLLLAKE